MKGIKYIGAIWDRCYSSDTEVLTKTGWKLFKDLVHEDEVATLDSNQALVYQKPEEIISMPWNGPMLRFSLPHGGVDLIVSPNHQMYVNTRAGKCKQTLTGQNTWRLERATDSFGMYRFYKKNADRYDAEGPETLVLANRCVRTKDWMEFLGYYISEGSSTTTKEGHYIVQLRQIKSQETLKRMADAMQRITPSKVNTRNDGRVIVNDKDLCLYLKESQGRSVTKNIPRDILTTCSRAQLRILFDALMVGDGHYPPQGKRGGARYSTSSLQLRDDFQELLLRIGLSGDYSIDKPAGTETSVYESGEKRVIKSTVNSWSISVRKKLHEPASCNWKKGKATFTEVDYSGHIYCAVVPNHTMYVRRNGKAVWSGNSGYAEAARGYVLALHKTGIPLTVQPLSFEPNPPPLENMELSMTLQRLCANPIEYDTVIAHVTPDLFPRLRAEYPNKFFIGMTVWETSMIHPKWVQACNMTDAVMVPCQWNVEAFKASGVGKPVVKVVHGLDPNTFDGINGDLNVPGLEPDRYKFFSILQWHYRKNPHGMLRAYYRAFNSGEKVALIIKTYRGGNHTIDEDKAFFREEIDKIAAHIPVERRPPVIIIPESMSGRDMLRLYKTGDCLVSLHRGEGFGLVPAMAGLAGKPVIATGATGNMEYMDAANSFPIKYQWAQVSGMDTFNSWYLGDQAWTEPNVIDAAEKMKYVFNNREEANVRAQRLMMKIKGSFNLDRVGQIMLDELQKLNP
jgi:glycosyltransferase involved in cell wall biosynthesis